MLSAKDVMTRKILRLSPETRVKEAVEMLLSRGITGAPVADGRGRPVGVLSQTDLVRRGSLPESQRVPAFYREGDQIRVTPVLESVDDLPVAEVMTTSVYSAEEETPVSELARLMLRLRIHRVMITKGGRLTGIVSSMDLLKIVARLDGSAGRPRTARRGSR